MITLPSPSRWDQVLLSDPPVDFCMNVIDYFLQASNHQDWCKHWFKSSSVKDFDRQVHILETPTYCVLSRASSTFHFSWSYDPEVTFVVFNP